MQRNESEIWESRDDAPHNFMIGILQDALSVCNVNIIVDTLSGHDDI